MLKKKKKEWYYACTCYFYWATAADVWLISPGELLLLNTNEHYLDKLTTYWESMWLHFHLK